MSDQTATLSGPDLAKGVGSAEIPEGGTLLGHVEGEAVLLARHNGEVFAVGATCTHYGAPLADGLVIDGTIRCPWHHAAFSLRTGCVVRPPARDDIPCWTVEETGGTAAVTNKKDSVSTSVTMRAPAAPNAQSWPESVVIIGGGAAGAIAAETLRRAGYDRAVTIVEAGPSAPYDRPNLSKDFLAGTASEEWIPLRPPSFYKEKRIDLLLDRRVVAIDPIAQRQGQAAARNILAGRSGTRQTFSAVPFFWTKHYDVTINYVGHAESWDDAEVDGDLEAHSAEVTYRANGRALAVATVYRDAASLRAEATLEHDLVEGLLAIS